MENSDKISKTIQAVASKFKASKEKKEHVIIKDFKKHYVKDDKVMLTPAGYAEFKRKGIVK